MKASLLKNILISGLLLLVGMFYSVPSYAQFTLPNVDPSNIFQNADETKKGADQIKFIKNLTKGINKVTGAIGNSPIFKGVKNLFKSIGGLFGKKHGLEAIDIKDKNYHKIDSNRKKLIKFMKKIKEDDDENSGQSLGSTIGGAVGGNVGAAVGGALGGALDRNKIRQIQQEIMINATAEAYAQGIAARPYFNKVGDEKSEVEKKQEDFDSSFEQATDLVGKLDSLSLISQEQLFTISYINGLMSAQLEMLAANAISSL